MMPTGKASGNAVLAKARALGAEVGRALKEKIKNFQ